MEHIPTKESYIQKVCTIAKELDISIEQAAMTCDAFYLAFSDEGMRRAIFGMIDELDESAARKGEPLGLIINYSVELTKDGIRVGRYADEVPPGQALELTPPDQAMIFLRITDDFPTQEVLGPMIVNRPELPSVSEPGAVATGRFEDEYPHRPAGSTSDIRQTDAFYRDDRVVCSESELTRTVIPLGPSSLESATTVICLGPIRLKFNERFPFVSAARSETLHARPTFCYMSADRTALSRPLGIAASRSGHPISGLSPPSPVGELRHSEAKDFLRPNIRALVAKT